MLLADIAAGKLDFDSFSKTAITKTREEVQALLGNGLIEGEIAMLACPSCGQPSCIKLASKAGNAYWKCRACDAAFGDDGGKPGRPFEKIEEKEDGASRPKPESGPACPKCKRKTGKYLTRANAKPYFRCTSCKQNYWPDFKDANAIGKAWEARA
jgi:DNA topoisomerase-3